MISNTKNTNLTWVYPPNNWISDYKQTFVYGWSNPNAKLFISVWAYHGKPFLQPIKIFPNGNFAQTIKLPDKKNIVKLVQVLNQNKKIITRYIIARNPARRACGRMPPRVKTTKPKDFIKNNMVIIIDPGHGGKEHGTHSPKGIPEKIFNLQIAKNIVEACGRMPLRRKHIYLTRSVDKFVSLQQRANFAKKKKCNLFISIHHNALPDNENPLKHRGVGIYYTHDSVRPMAQRFLENISKESRLKKYGIFRRDFAVTRPNFYTGILIECGFLIHPVESELITSKKMQSKIAQGIVKSILFNKSS